MRGLFLAIHVFLCGFADAFAWMCETSPHMMVPMFESIQPKAASNVQIEQARAPGSPSPRRLPETIVERACKLACVAALAVMLIVIGTDIVTRSLFNFSFEISDELGGYMLVVITFVSLPVCQISDSFHHVELVQSRLSPRARVVSHVIFDVLSLALCLLLFWQLVRFQISSFRFGDQAPTYLATPLWIPRIAMATGAAALCFSMLRTLAADVAALRAAGSMTAASRES
jgi:TRAP-type transport system small permease protein